MPVSARVGGSTSAGPITASYTTTLGQDSRMIVAFMFFAGVFALVGYEKKTTQGKKTVPPARIVLGGTVAAAGLTLLSHAGEGGKKFAVGLAGVTFASSALINGSAVFGSINTLTGSKATAASTPSKPSTPSTPTSGVKSVASATPVVLGGL